MTEAYHQPADSYELTLLGNLFIRVGLKMTACLQLYQRYRVGGTAMNTFTEVGM